MSKKTLLLFLVIPLFVYRCIGQDSRIICFKGAISNISTGEPIAFASIRVAENNINTMTNEAGHFVFKIPAGSQNQTIYVSHVSYKTISINFTSTDTSFMSIKMKEEITKLSEVTVKKTNPVELLNKAIERIPENYPSSRYLLSGFYRLTGYKEKRIIHLSEAVFEIFNENNSAKKRQFKLVKSRVDKDLTAFNGSDNVEMGLSPQSILDFDIISNIKESEILNREGQKNHDFIFKGLIDYKGQQAYVIYFDEKNGIKKSLYKGKIIINADNFAFLEFDIHLSEKGLKYFDWSLFMRLNLSLSHILAKLLSDDYKITYETYGGKYYINSVNNVGTTFLAGGNKHFILDPLLESTVYLVTRIDTLGIEPFNEKEILSNKKRIESQGKIMNDTKDSPDHSDTTDRFWENYNLIQADFNVDSAVNIIQSNNASLNLKKILQQKLPKYSKDKITRIDSILNYYYQKDQFNGTALIQYKGERIYEKGFGMADQDHKVPNTGTTAFRIGSTSKQFTSMLIMQLVNKNKLSVLDSVGKYLPDYAHGNVTIQQLLTHQSGIPNYTANPTYFIKIINNKYSVDQIVYQFCSDSLEFAPGTQFSYSNSNYVILADLIEKITGKGYSDVLEEQIFNPLAMKHSYFIKGTSTNQAIGYVNGLPEKPYPIENVTGAGGITSTSEDLLIWSNALNSDKLLPKDKLEELFKPRVEWKDWDAFYGYGWMIDRNLFQVSQSNIVRYHPGTEFGFFDMLVLQPDKDIVIILLNNTGDFPRFDITDLILSELNK